MTPQEKSEYNKLFKNILISICSGLNLNITCNYMQYNKYGANSDEVRKTLTDKPAVHPNILINGVDFFKNQYTIFKNDDKVNPILFDIDIGNKIWEYADNILENKKDKDVFYTYFENCNKSYYNDHFRQIIYSSTDEKFFKYLESCIPKDTETCSLGKFKKDFHLLKNRKFDTLEQKDILFRFSKFYKKIIRRVDIRPIFCDLIAQKIPVNQHAPYVKIVGREIFTNLEATPEDIMAEPTPSQTLPLKKDKIFEKIKITDLDIPSVSVINDIHIKLTTAFNFKSIKEKLGLVDTHFVEFFAAHNRGKITFEFTDENHREDMSMIYLICLKSCARNYSSQAKNYNEVVEKTISHYLLEKNLPEKAEKSTLTRKI